MALSKKAEGRAGGCRNEDADILNPISILAVTKIDRIQNVQIRSVKVNIWFSGRVIVRESEEKKKSPVFCEPHFL